MHCPNCGAENRQERRFCAKCGALVGIQCPNCSFVNEPGDNFCGGCGHALTALGPSVEPPSSGPSILQHEISSAERRQITVMFCDLVGSTELSEKLEAEQLREVIHGFQETCRAVIARFEGFIARYMGDGILAYFGYPQAHEQDAERAVRAGLSVVEAIAGLNDELGYDRQEGVELAARVGIATGPVIVGDVVGQGAAEEKTVVGQTPNLAARLQALAEPNTVVIAAATRRLTDGLFEYENLGSHPLKGFSEPVPAWRVIRAREAGTRFEAAHRADLTPMVNREEEIDILLRRWQRARDGEGQVVLVSGESGLGKSRLVQALRERIAADPHIRLRYQCSPCFTDSALYPVVEQLSRAARLAPDDTPRRKLDKLEAMVSWGTDRVKDVAPLFADVLSIPAGERYPPHDLSPEQRKEKILTALIKQMEGLAARQPLLVVFEDVHWIDPTSLELLDRAVDRVQAVPVLMIVTFRPHFAPPWLGQAHVALLALSRMGRRQCAAMVERVARGKKLPDEIVDQIVTKTDGVPLFVEEVTKMVLDSAVLAEEADRYVLTSPLPPLAIPTSLCDSLMGRLDQMGAVKQIAQVAAAIGHEFTSKLLKAVSPLREDELRDALNQLVTSGLIVQRGTEPHAIYAFKHMLIQEMAYESLLKSKRRELHQKIAQTLENDFPEVVHSHPELLAYHYTQAGLAEQAVDYWRQAGKQAIERSAHLEAIGHLSKGLKVLESLMDGPERARKELVLLATMGISLSLTDSIALEDVERIYIQVRELSRQFSRPSELFPVFWGLWAFYRDRGALLKMRELVEELRILAERERQRPLLLQANHAQWTTFLLLGEPTAALEHVEQGLAFYDLKADHGQALLYGGHDPGVCGHGLAALCDWLLGYPDKARERSHQALVLAKQLTHLPSLAHALGLVCMLSQFQRDAAAVQRSAEEMIEIAEKQRLKRYLFMGKFLQAWALSEQGHAGDSIARMREILSELKIYRSAVPLTYYLAIVAEAYGEQGQPDEGLSLLSEAFVTAEQAGIRFWEPELHRVQGELILIGSVTKDIEAEACFRKAIEVARDQHAESLELRAASSLARLWRKQGRSLEARDLLAPIYGWFIEGFDTADLRDAKALLNELHPSGSNLTAEDGGYRLRV